MPTFHDRRTGDVEDLIAQSERPLVDRLYGAQDINKMFGESEITPTPWAQAGGLKHHNLYDKSVVHKELSRPASEVSTVKVDPRMLKSSQPGITRQGVSYYMGDEYARTGRTFADQESKGNQQPVVYSRTHPNTGRVDEILLSGHHRAAAALLQGRSLEARRVEGGFGPEYAANRMENMFNDRRDA